MPGRVEVGKLAKFLFVIRMYSLPNEILKILSCSHWKITCRIHFLFIWSNLYYKVLCCCRLKKLNFTSKIYFLTFHSIPRCYISETMFAAKKINENSPNFLNKSHTFHLQLTFHVIGILIKVHKVTHSAPPDQAKYWPVPSAHLSNIWTEYASYWNEHLFRLWGPLSIYVIFLSAFGFYLHKHSKNSVSISS